MIFHGNAVSPGVAVGPVYVYGAAAAVCPTGVYRGRANTGRRPRLCCGAGQSAEQLHALRQRLEKTDVEKAAIFDAHLDLTDDEVIVEEVERKYCATGTRQSLLYKAYMGAMQM